MRKIKTFNVEEDIYNDLLKTFKRHRVKASLSTFVNNCLRDLMTYIKELEQARKSAPSFKVPMSFVIGKLTEGLVNKKNVKPFVVEAGERAEERYKEAYEDLLLSMWEEEYEAEQRGISVEMYSHLKDGGYFLAPNKQYLIAEKTGKKYFVAPNGSGGSVLLEIKEE